MFAILIGLLAAGGWATGDAAKLTQGREIYETACAACHGRDGNGNPEWESEVRPVELSDCGTTAEPTELWHGVVTNGGPYAGLDAKMPAFGEAYSSEEIGAVVAYLRTFCEGADAYPPGDLNFRRALKTGKAFPEAEIVLRASHRPRESDRETELEVLYENRLGPRFQYELVLPMRVQGAEGTGIADIEVEAKQVLWFSQRELSILSAGVGLTFPTGSESKGLSDGTVVFAPYAAFGKGFGSRGRSMFQTRIGAHLPADGDKASPTFDWAVALSQALGPARRAWTPAVELVGSYDFDTKEHAFATWVEISKPLNTLGHVIASVGAQIPVRPKSASWRLEAYVLWDFGDGPFWVGW